MDLPDARPAEGEAASDYEVVAWGLNSPRGLAVDDRGNVYVAEAGVAGSECVVPKAGKCFGFGGSIQRYSNLLTPNPTRTTVVSGLVSMAMLRDDGDEVVGIDGIDFTDDGELLGVIGFSTPGLEAGFQAVSPPFVPSPEVDAAVKAYPGRLVGVGDDGSLNVLLDIGSIDYAWAEQNKDAPWAPDGQFPDSNPYAVLAEGGRVWVANPGTNVVSEVFVGGGEPASRLLAYIPSPSPGTASVPTCVAKHGQWLFVGTLDFVGNYGAKRPVSRIYRIDVGATDPFTAAEEWATEFNPITACTVIDGSLYVSEYATAATDYAFGAVVRVRINDDDTAGRREVLADDLVRPAGIAALGPSILVVNHSVGVAGSGPDVPGGQIVRLLR